jgi:hypothetical protein
MVTYPPDPLSLGIDKGKGVKRKRGFASLRYPFFSAGEAFHPPLPRGRLALKVIPRSESTKEFKSGASPFDRLRMSGIGGAGFPLSRE